MADESSRAERPAAIPQQEIARISTLPDRLERGLSFVAALERALGSTPRFGPIVVGGFAVEFYTAGGYTTQDIDLVMMHPRDADAILAASGFTRRGRYWSHEGLDLLVEFPGLALNNPGAAERIRRVDVDGTPVNVIGPEDIIVGRLFRAVREGSTEAGNRALEMMVLRFADIDWEALMELATGEGIADEARRMRSRAEALRAELDA